MSTLPKHQELHVKNVQTHTLNNNSSLEKHQDSLQEQANRPTSQYPFSLVPNVDMLTESSYQKKSKLSMGSNYDGLQEDIYNTEDDI